MGGTAFAHVRDSGPLTRRALLVAVVCLVADTVSFWSWSSGLCSPILRWGVLAAIAVIDAALAAAPRLPGVVALAQVGIAVSSAAVLPGAIPIVNDMGLIVSAYGAGAWLERGTAVAVLVCMAAGMAADRFLSEMHSPRALLLVPVENAVLPWLVGRYTTGRRGYIADLEQRAEHERRDAQQAMAEAIAEERTAIARDLHDVIAHHVSAIGMHAGAARLATTAPASEDVLRSLSAVETSSRAAMLDLRRMLDVLHGNRPEGARQPGLANIDELLDTVTAAGLRVRLTTEGVPPVLPGSLDLAVYRVVQEMLTNALRHGDGSTAEVDLRYDDSTLTATCVNPVRCTEPRAWAAAAHRGLDGIRSRAAMFNGSAAYGPTPDGTVWRTTAAFPLDHLDRTDHVDALDDVGHPDHPESPNTPESLERL